MKVLLVLQELPRITEVGHNDKGQHIVEFEMEDVLKLAETMTYIVYKPNSQGGMAKQMAAGLGLQGLLWTAKKLFMRRS